MDMEMEMEMVIRSVEEFSESRVQTGTAHRGFRYEAGPS